jgi:hypothetical protein
VVLVIYVSSLDYFIVAYCYSLFHIIIPYFSFLLMFSSLTFYLLAIIFKIPLFLLFLLSSFHLRGTVTFALLCETPSRYCIEYSDGTLHDVWTFELIAIVSAFVAIVGYLRVSFLQKQEQQEYGMIQQHNDMQIQTEESDDNTILLVRNDNGVST